MASYVVLGAKNLVQMKWKREVFFSDAGLLPVIAGTSSVALVEWP